MVRGLLKTHSLLFLNLFLFFLVIIYVGPWHETPISDDWSYTLTARHLFDTGNYQLHPWSSSNIMFQAYWGVLIAWISGFSFGSLHISTIILTVLGLIAFYFLAQEHNLSPNQAGLVTLSLLSSPFVIYFMFTFMTDVPLLSLLIISLLFLTKGLHRSNYGFMFLGSLTTLAAIYVRPTGLALVAGLGCIWLMDRLRWRKIGLYATGAIIPTLGAFYLLFGGTLAQFQSGSFNGDGQTRFMSNIPGFLGEVLLWRPGIFLQYMALFSLPLVVVCLASPFVGIKSFFTNKNLILFLVIFELAAMLYSRFIQNGSLIMPYLQWNLPSLSGNRLLSIFTTLLTLVGSIIYVIVFTKRFLPITDWLKISLAERLLDLTTFFLLLYHLLFFNLGDRYLIVLIPFTLIVVGRSIQLQLVQLSRLVIAFTFVLLLICSVWTRDIQAKDEAKWQASESIRLQGVNPRYISSTWGWYCTYNFDAYLKETPVKSSLDYFFNVWLVDRDNEAQYHVVETLDELSDLRSGGSWQIVKTWPYQDGLYQTKELLIVKKQP